MVKYSIFLERRVQYERNGLCASLQQQFYVKNVQKIAFYGITAPFLKCYHKHLCR